MTAIAAIPFSEPDECFFLFLSQPLRQNSFNLTFSPIIGEYYSMAVEIFSLIQIWYM